MKYTSIFQEGEINHDRFTQAVIDLMCQEEASLAAILPLPTREERT